MNKFVRIIEGFVAIPILVFLFMVLIIQVFFRYILNNPLQWTQEVATVLFIWICLLGSYLSVHYNLMVKMDVLVERLSPKNKDRIEFFGSSLLLIISLLLIPSSYVIVDMHVDLEFATLPFSQGFLYAAGPVAFLLISISLLHRLLNRLKQWRHSR